MKRNLLTAAAVVVLSAALSVSAVAALTGHSTAQNGQAGPPVTTHTAQVTRDGFPVNDWGLTVGEPNVDAIRSRDLPDLIAVPGESAFLKSSEVYFPEPKNPAEAVEQTNRLVNEDGEIVATLYAADGKTVLGQLVLGTVKLGGTTDGQ